MSRVNTVKLKTIYNVNNTLELKAVIQKMFDNDNSLTEIAQHFNVSAAAIHTRCKALGIECLIYNF